MGFFSAFGAFRMTVLLHLHTMNLSPLFWPVRLEKDRILILDETRLPHKETYLQARTFKDSVKAIKQMQTRAVGQVLLVMYTFLLEVRRIDDKSQLLPIFERIAVAFNSARPTLSFKMLTDMVLGWSRQGAPIEKMILGFLEGLKQARIKQAQQAASLLVDADTVLTHCNVSGLMPLIGDLCRQQHKKVSFYVTETRPYLQGSRLTAWELQKAGLPVTVIADNMVAQVCFEGKISKVIVGADNLAKNGDFANKIGTYQIALIAKHFQIPFYVLCPPASGAHSGKDIKIEVRPDKDLLEFAGVRVAPKGVNGYYPAFDITPHYLVTKHIYLELGR